MEAQQQNIPGSPPRLMNSIVAGFNSVTNHLGLILLPVLLDLFLWLGPQFHLQKLLGSALDDSFNYLLDMNSPDLASRLQQFDTLWKELLANFNLAGLLRTIPIGIPSLMATQTTTANPLGKADILEIGSGIAAFGLLMVFLVVGFMFGCIYFNQIARSIQDSPVPFDFKEFGRETVQSLALVIGLFMVILFLLFPVSMLLSIFVLINASLADIVLALIGFFVLWMAIPLVFTPHSIFLGQRNLIVSLLTSIRLVRSFLPGTSLFILAAVLITQGLDVLWLVPPANSWLMLVGIVGHAFIYTSILSASFIYFRNGLRWMVQVIQQRESRSIQA
jgi:hypothetical protein